MPEFAKAVTLTLDPNRPGGHVLPEVLLARTLQATQPSFLLSVPVCVCVCVCVFVCGTFCATSMQNISETKRSSGFCQMGTIHVIGNDIWRVDWWCQRRRHVTVWRHIDALMIFKGVALRYLGSDLLISQTLVRTRHTYQNLQQHHAFSFRQDGLLVLMQFPIAINKNKKQKFANRTELRHAWP